MKRGDASGRDPWRVVSHRAGDPGRDRHRHVPLPDRWPSRFVGWHVPREQRVRRQTPLRQDPSRIEMASHRVGRSRTSCGQVEKHLPRIALPPHSADVEDQQKQPSRPVTASSSSPGISCLPARSTPTSGPTTSTSDAPAQRTATGSSRNSKHSDLTWSSPPKPPDHTTTSGSAATGATAPAPPRAPTPNHTRIHTSVEPPLLDKRFVLHEAEQRRA